MFDFQVYLVAICNAIYSYWANPRRLEYSTHPLWHTVISRMCAEASPRLWASPQWAIYHSPNDDLTSTSDILTGLDDETRLNITMADSKAVGVVPDFAIIMPVFPRMESGPFTRYETIVDYVQGRHPFFSKTEAWYNFVPTIRLSHYLAVLLNELKRPPKRSAKNIVQYAKSILHSIDQAQEQLGDQAFGLFSSVKYAEQNTVFLLAGAGEFWSFKSLSREFVRSQLKDASKVFDVAKYCGQHLENNNAVNPEDANDEDEPHNEPVHMDLVKDLGATYAREKAKHHEEGKDLVEAQRLASIERSNKWATRMPPYSDFLAEESGPGPFSNVELAALSTYVANGECTESKLTGFRFGLCPGDRPGQFFGSKWSPILRLGTPDSDKCMAYITKELGVAATKQAL